MPNTQRPRSNDLTRQSSAASLKSILIGLDGSRHSDAAVELALAWAGRFDCLLVAIGIIDEPTIHGPQSPISQSYQKAYDQLLSTETRQIEQYLEKFAIRCSDAQVPFKLLEDEGQPSEQILLESQRYDLILLGRQTHFRAGSHDRPCKTIESVIRNSPRPVVAVPETPSNQAGAGVLIAFDGSLQSARALQAFIGIGLDALGPVHVVCIDPDSSVAAARTADRAVEFLRFHDIPATPRNLTTKYAPGRVFVEQASELNVELIVMGAYGRPALTEFLLGSATCTALKESPVPVMLYH